ncbi:MAG: hypothetical protein ACI9HK_002181 [Pirellulaceae bacterium]|jgi:hypothetical protein
MGIGTETSGMVRIYRTQEMFKCDEFVYSSANRGELLIGEEPVSTFSSQLSANASRSKQIDSFAISRFIVAQ